MEKLTAGPAMYDTDREHHLAIGKSDRKTLKFVTPGAN